jgi:beta-lactamase class A
MTRISRRAALGAVALLGLGGCGTGPRPRRPAASPTARRSTPPPVPPARFAALERLYGARLGVYALATTGGGATVTYRADERFAFCSTFKPLAVAAVLAQRPLSHLDTLVRYTAADVDSISPVTQDHVATGLTVRQLCDAAIRYSDGTAGNLLMRDIGGPARLTAWLRTLGDTTSRMDDEEPELNRHDPQDPRDTTTPRALATLYRGLILGDTLPTQQRILLTDWLKRTVTTAARIPAAVPTSWTLAHKTGTGDYGRASDVAVAWRRSAPPVVIAVMSDRAGYHTQPAEPLLADATRLVVPALG